MSELLLILAGLAASKEIRETACKIVENIVGPISNEAGQIVALPLKALRERFVARTVTRASEIIVEQNLTVEVVHPKLLTSILEGCSLEDDEEMAELWARLLASAATGAQVHPAYPGILKELTPLEAKLLEEFDPNLSRQAAVKSAVVHDQSLRVARANLQRLSLTAGDGWYELYSKLYLPGLSDLGWDFVAKCRGPGWTWESYRSPTYSAAE